MNKTISEIIRNIDNFINIKNPDDQTLFLLNSIKLNMLLLLEKNNFFSDDTNDFQEYSDILNKISTIIMGDDECFVTVQKLLQIVAKKL